MRRARARAAALAALALLAAPARAGTEPARPKPGLGPLAPALEGTWELVSIQRPGGPVLRPPAVFGALVVDGGSILSASYAQDASGRRVGTLWEGSLLLDGSRYRVEPRRGMRHDSAADPPNVEVEPPPSGGTYRVGDGEVVFERDDGARTTWTAKDQRRVQVEPDGTRIEHRRTSLVPRVPEGLPGR